MTLLKALAVSLGSLLLIPVLALGAIAGGFGHIPDAYDHAAAVIGVGELEVAVLTHPAIHLTTNAHRDVEAGVVDPRVLHVLLALAERFELGPVGPFITGHSYYVKGTTRVSNHMLGRAVDILGVNGAPVSPSHPGARALMQAILALPEAVRPDELGGPWVMSSGGLRTFTKDHLDHIHAGWRL